MEQLCDLSTAEGLQLLEDHLEKTGAGMYVNGDAPSPSDVDAFVAARGSDDLAAALATPGGDWQPGQTTMPRVWKWAQKMKSALAEQKKWDQDNLTPSSPRPGVPKEVLEDIVAEANLKKRYADTLAQVQSSRAGARPPSTAGGQRGGSSGGSGPRGSPAMYASPLSPRHLRTPTFKTPLSGARTPGGGRRVTDSCSPLSACSQLNACGCSVLCRCTSVAAGGIGGASGNGGMPSTPFARRLDRLGGGGPGGGGSGGGASGSARSPFGASPRGGAEGSPLGGGGGVGSPIAGAGSTPHHMRRIRGASSLGGGGGGSIGGGNGGVDGGRDSPRVYQQSNLSSGSLARTPYGNRGGAAAATPYGTPFATPIGSGGVVRKNTPYGTPSAAATPYGTPFSTPAALPAAMQASSGRLDAAENDLISMASEVDELKLRMAALIQQAKQFH